jgi:hypothetical protein
MNIWYTGILDCVTVGQYEVYFGGIFIFNFTYANIIILYRNNNNNNNNTKFKQNLSCIRIINFWLMRN